MANPLFTIASYFTAAVEVMEDLERGHEPVRTVKRALRKASRRIRAIEKSDARPLLSLCPCGCGLPEGQCAGTNSGSKS